MDGQVSGRATAESYIYQGMVFDPFILEVEIVFAWPLHKAKHDCDGVLLGLVPERASQHGGYAPEA